VRKLIDRSKDIERSGMKVETTSTLPEWHIAVLLQHRDRNCTVSDPKRYVDVAIEPGQ